MVERPRMGEVEREAKSKEPNALKSKSDSRRSSKSCAGRLEPGSLARPLPQRDKRDARAPILFCALATTTDKRTRAKEVRERSTGL